MIKCLRHIRRPERNINHTGWGDCTICQPDYNNKFCDGYRPVTWNEIKIAEKDNGPDRSS